MAHVRHVIRCVHNREVEELREEVIQQHWDLYVAGRVSKEWEAQAYWQRQVAGSTVHAHVSGVTTRRRMQLLRSTRLMTALRAIMISEAGTAERQLYRAITTMTLGLQDSQRLWGTPMKLSALYRIWRQVPENDMHICLMAWMMQQRSEKEDARKYKFFLMAKVITGPHQCNWFFMAKAPVSVLATGKLRAVSQWAINTKLTTHFSERVAARAWATPGVCKFLEQYQRRAVRAHSALTAMLTMGSQTGSGHNGGEWFSSH